MKYAVETWDPGYGSSAGSGVRESDLDATTRPVDVSVERAVDEWRPLTPSSGDTPDVITFVDGVRRIDARLWIDEPEGLSRTGVCASVAAGAVRCTSTAATIEVAVVRRGLYTASEHADSVQNSLGSYELRSVADDSDEAMYFGVHTHMAELESQVSEELDEPGDVVFDGPLGQRNSANAVGYVKSQHVHYLPPELRSVVGQLDAGDRTPLFLIGGQFPTWSWYLRLPQPGTRQHNMSGIVRLELPALGDAEDAGQRADAVSSALPRFASAPHKDTRAPQNLYPIAGLERQLRRRLGDAKLLERALRRGAV